MERREARNEVVVVDIDWPFWSMVRFMVKWVIAAIPAIVLLALIGAGVAASISVIASGVHRLSEKAAHVQEPPRETSPSESPPMPRGPTGTEQRCASTPNPAQCVAQEIRCAGNPEYNKCMEQERRAASETPEQKAERVRKLDAEREENMRKVR
jgi:hypothetical protein